MFPAKETDMEVNLCPYANCGIASCSVNSKSDHVDKDIETVVNIDQSITAICPANGEIKYKMVHNPESFMNNFNTNTSPAENIIDAVDGSINFCTTAKRKNPEPVASLDKTPKKCKLWSQKNLEKAVDAVKTGMDLTVAAKQFSVPHTTLKYKLGDSCITEADEPFNQMQKESSTNTMDGNTQCKIPATTLQYKIGNTCITLVDPLNQVVKISSTVDTNSQPKIQLQLQSSKLMQIPLVMLKSSAGNNTLKNPKITLSTKNSSRLQLQDKTALELSENKKISDHDTTYFKGDKLSKKWSEEAMNKAVEALEQGSKLRFVSELYGVPISSIRYRLAIKMLNFINTKTKPPANCITTTSFKPDSTSTCVKMPEIISLESSTTSEVSEPLNSAQVGTLSQVVETPQENTPVSSTTTNTLKIIETLDTTQDNASSKVEETPQKNIPVSSTTTKIIEPWDTTQASASSKVEETPQENTAEAQCQTSNKCKKRPRQLQLTESMHKALDELRSNKSMSLSEAAKKYNISLKTLKIKKKKQDHIFTKIHGPDPHLTQQDEEPLLSYINDTCPRFGITNMKPVVLFLVAEIAENQGLWDIKKQGLPAEEWWESFCVRQEHHIQNTNITDCKQSIKLSRAKIDRFYDKLSAVIHGSQYHDLQLVYNRVSNIYTVQGFQFDMDTVSKLVVDTSPAASDSVTDKLVTTICCACASGISMPPMFVYHSNSGFSLSPTLFGPTGAYHFVHHVNDKSRDSHIYFKWFLFIFLKYAPPSRPLILLLDPDTSFITPEFADIAHKNEVILLCLPTSSTHITQPLNITVFPALQKGFKYVSSLFKKVFAKGVNFGNFARCFKVAWNTSVDEETIRTGFRKAGISPLDRKVIDDKDLPYV